MQPSPTRSLRAGSPLSRIAGEGGERSEAGVRGPPRNSQTFDKRALSMSFTDLFIRRPVLSLVVSLLILLIGLKAMTSLPIRQYPKLSNTTITVTTIYPGASPDLIEGFITTPISQAVATAEGIDYLTSNSVQGTSTVIAYIRLNYDPSQALTDIMAKVQQVKYQIPTEAQDPIIVKATGQTTAVMYIGFASSELSSAAISDYLTRVVQPLLATVDGVASADILGGQTFAMRLWLDPARMAARGISADDIARGDPRQQLPIGTGPGEGLFYGRQRRRRHRARRCRAVQENGGKVKERRAGADGGHRRRRSRRSELDLERGDERAARGIHRRAGDPDRQSAVAGRGGASTLARDPAQPAAFAQDGGRLQFDQVHPGLDQRGQVDPRAGRRHRHRRHLSVPWQLPLGADPDRDDPAVAGRRRHDHGGARLQR